MIKREFTFAAIPGLEVPLNKGEAALKREGEALFQDWSKDKMRLPENVRRELYAAGFTN